ncbi:MAG: GSCFA domain-containing protein [Cyclobacteriaceae bacterium]
MKNFRTEFDFKPCDQKLSHGKKILTIGSCFSEVMGDKLQAHKFNILKNPFGVIFNPASIFQLVSDSLLKKRFDDALFLSRNDQYFHFQVHSKINASKKETLSIAIGEIQKEVNHFLSESSHIFITFGTSYAFQHIEYHQIVANCHKQPHKLFQKILLSLEEMIHSFENFYHLLKSLNPNSTIILTVSPVRHLKDGLLNNQVSKSQLRIFCDLMEKDHPNVYYFPSYELMMDDLRDYRFYREDMIHPNDMAENYIWEKFQETFFEENTLQLIRQIDKINKGMSHRPFDPNSVHYKDFLLGMANSIRKMPDDLDFTAESQFIEEQIRSIDGRIKLI